MAHTVGYWYSVIIGEKQNMTALTGMQPAIDDEQTLLTDLDSASKVADWRTFAYVIAYCMFTLEKFWDIFLAQVYAIIALFRPGTLRWYKEQALLFQYGHELVWNATTRKYEYAVVDEDAKIVKLCSVAETGGVVRVKVANLVGGVPVALTTLELAGLSAYFSKVKYPGKVVCVSYDADLLKIYGILKFDPSTVEATVVAAVETTIKGYLKGLDFDGRFIITQLRELVLAVPGVIDFTHIAVETKYGLLNYQVVDDEYQTYAGYAQIDDNYFPLSSTLTSQPYV